MESAGRCQGEADEKVLVSWPHCPHWWQSCSRWRRWRGLHSATHPATHWDLITASININSSLPWLTPDKCPAHAAPDTASDQVFLYPVIGISAAWIFASFQENCGASWRQCFHCRIVAAVTAVTANCKPQGPVFSAVVLNVLGYKGRVLGAERCS